MNFGQIIENKKLSFYIGIENSIYSILIRIPISTLIHTISDSKSRKEEKNVVCVAIVSLFGHQLFFFVKQNKIGLFGINFVN